VHAAAWVLSMPKLAMHQIWYASVAWPRMQQGCHPKRPTGVAEDLQNFPARKSVDAESNGFIGRYSRKRSVVSCSRCNAPPPTKQRAENHRSYSDCAHDRTSCLHGKCGSARCCSSFLVAYVCISRPICGVVVRQNFVNRYAMGVVDAEHGEAGVCIAIQWCHYRA